MEYKFVFQFFLPVGGGTILSKVKEPFYGQDYAE